MNLTRYIPNTITSMNLLAGLVGVILTLEGRPQAAFPLMIAAAVFDFFDGFSARLLHAYSPIGKELDSLADLVSFGVLPALLLYKTMQQAGCPWPWVPYVCLFLAVMSALRLAKFNVDERQRTDFIGLATPAAAMICGSLAHFIVSHPTAWAARMAGSWWLLPAVSIVLGLLLVSELPMFGMKVGGDKKWSSLMDAKRAVFLVLSLGGVLVFVVFRVFWSLAVLWIFCVYLFVNIVYDLLNVKKKNK